MSKYTSRSNRETQSNSDWKAENLDWAEDSQWPGRSSEGFDYGRGREDFDYGRGREDFSYDFERGRDEEYGYGRGRDEDYGRERTEDRSRGRQKKAKKRGLIILIIVLLLAVIAGGAVFAFMKLSKPESKVDILRTNIEAAEVVDLGEFVVVKDKYAEDYVVTVAGDQKRKFMEVGDQAVEYTLANEKKSENFTVTFTVEDTTPPVIKIQNANVDKDADFDLTKVVSASDSLDGELPASSLSYEGTVDTTTVGSYDITVTAVDAAGNETTRNVQVKIAQPQGDPSEFIAKMSGLYLNGCKSSETAQKIANMTGSTDVSMTEFYVSNDKLYMTTIGDVTGQFDGEVVPDIKDGEVKLSNVSTDLKKAQGTAAGMRIEIDLSNIDSGVIYYKCGENATYCAHTGYDNEKAMNDYLETKYQ